MAANMMEILKQMNRNISVIDKKISELDKKMDQQQIITKIIARQVKNSNTLLFGNDEASIHFQNNTTDKSHMVDEKEKADIDNQSEEYTEKIETRRLQDPSKISFNCMCQTEAYCQDDNNKNDNKDTQDIVLQSISNELSEIKDYLRNFEAKLTDGKASLDQDRYLSTDQICKLSKELKRNCDEIKDFIRDSGVTELIKIKENLRNIETKISDGKTSLDQDQISKLSEELKRNCDEIKKNIRDSGVSQGTIGNVVSLDKRNTVKISPTYFNKEQISKLNAELKRIAKTYRSTNIPVIEVVPGCEHPIMEQLRKGLRYENSYRIDWIEIKLGVNGYKRSKVQELLNENPDLILSEVVTELFKSRGWKAEKLANYNLENPIPF